MSFVEGYNTSTSFRIDSIESTLNAYCDSIDSNIRTVLENTSTEIYQ